MDQPDAILKREFLIAVLFGAIVFAGLSVMPEYQAPTPMAEAADSVEQGKPVVEPTPEPAQLPEQSAG